MTDIALKMDAVYKRFRKGQMFDSLRDLIPTLTGRMFQRGGLEHVDRREFWALQDVSFEVNRGEAFGIIGHNGAGKSTLLKILSRIMQPTRGSMVVHGRLSALIEVTAGFHQDLTGRENVYLNGTILGMKRREIDSKFDAIVDFSGLADFLDTPIKRYSSGMLARLGFSVAAHVDPEVLIVDEVLSVGDFVFQQKCLARMREIVKNGTTVLFVSHNLRAVAELCNRGLLLDHGKVKFIGDTSEAIRHYMESIRTDQVTDHNKAVRITRVALKRGDSDCVQFESGERARLEIEAVAQKSVKRVAVVTHLVDENAYPLFSTSTERLGYEPYDLDAGDTLRCAFEFEFHMAYGTFHLAVELFRYDVDSSLDAWRPAVSFFVGSKLAGSRGAVDCKPRLVYQTLDRAEDDLQKSAKRIAGDSL